MTPSTQLLSRPSESTSKSRLSSLKERKSSFRFGILPDRRDSIRSQLLITRCHGNNAGLRHYKCQELR
uniref:Uncharacterized protein n=1 Tax=Ditylenchus dipsaci TaxID=166011 RepID=A0A915CMF6_9BILA